MEAIIKLITPEILDSMTYGDEVEINEQYSLNHHSEEDVITLVLTEEWEDIATVLRNDDGTILLEMCN